MTGLVNPTHNAIEIDGKTINIDTMSVQQAMLMVMNERIDSIGDATGKELQELLERQQKVTELQNIRAHINSVIDKDGKIVVAKDSELEKLLKRAEELGVKLPKTNGTFQRDDTSRLTENFRMVVEDLNTKNDMQLQKVTKYTNERYEAYQMARSILKPCDDAAKSAARNIAGK